MLNNKEELIHETVEQKALYTTPDVSACGNIFDITQGGGLLPGDTSLTLIDPGASS